MINSVIIVNCLPNHGLLTFYTNGSTPSPSTRRCTISASTSVQLITTVTIVINVAIIRIITITRRSVAIHRRGRT